MEAKKLNNQEKLDHMFEMVNELNTEMHHLKRKESAEGAFKLFYMAIIVAALGGAYYFLIPFFDTIKKIPDVIDKAQNKIDEVRNSAPNAETLGKTVTALKEGNIDQATIDKAQRIIDEAKAKISASSR